MGANGIRHTIDHTAWFVINGNLGADGNRRLVRDKIQHRLSSILLYDPAELLSLVTSTVPTRWEMAASYCFAKIWGKKES